MFEHRILLIDPFRNLSNTCQAILTGEKYLVDTALNLEEASRLCEGKRYSAIVTEYFPPFEEIGSLIQSVKRRCPETYQIAVTDLPLSESMCEKLFDVGLDDLISRGCSPERVLTHLKKGLRRRDLMLRKRELEAQSLLDPAAQEVGQLIFNPVFFRNRFRQELKKAKRHRHPLSLLILRIPTVQEVGDRFEDFYSNLARIIRKYVREEDIVGRENGSFGILLPRTDQTGCEVLEKRLSALVRNHPTFQSDDALRSIVHTLSLRSFTYPDQFVIPGSLRAVFEEVNKQSPRR